MSGKCDASCYPPDGRPAGRPGHPEVTEEDMQQMMADLSELGWGHHAIADLSGRPHAAVLELVMRNFPAATRTYSPLMREHGKGQQP